MSGDGNVPPYTIPVDGQQGGGVKVYHVHTPFTPPTSSQETSASQVTPVYSSGGAVIDTGTSTKKTHVSYDVGLGRNPGMTRCPSCQQQVMTEVTYKAGTYAWLMCLLFICLGLVLCCCLIPFFVKKFKDAYHHCPNCKRVLYVDKKECCK
ncbi:lipopolysaccharide-induced tumor necrosis factor-alpha factor homolog-like [Mugil cephalus]|uniref:lipopolysaccharide-induced tumor necrosis factor-alpha factor homolog-like n=1 Tax=Mugil cephalus TaxID=48193 RepID=UPI001FB6372D|nr:lipopolysaccharide-induced tumor necrosis factor-alpha factor homolog-like [Mugil cephalus]XP_047427281.1 lipopolysaccharide-induced tumor necrosis factor-alpha factor homolog-like [Mugil cephalus]